MNQEKIFTRLLEEKNKQAEKIIEEAKREYKKIIGELEKEAFSYYRKWFEERRQRIIRDTQEKMFNIKLEVKKKILLKKEEIKDKAFKEIKNFLEKNREFIPKKKIITPQGIVEEEVDIKEFLQFLSEKYAKEIEEFIKI